MSHPEIVVIGGSAGAHEPLRAVLSRLQPDIQAAVFVVTHVLPESDGLLAKRLQQNSKLRVKPALDGDTIVHGTVYVAAPDVHLVVRQGVIRLVRGPRENRWRPSIDVLFRSAAVNYGSRVIGVLLSGALDDGVAGLVAIKRCGGSAIVQDPTDAQFAQMPQVAIRQTQVDHIVVAQEIATVVQRLVNESISLATEVPSDLRLEAQIAETGHSSIELPERLGELSSFTCPDCGGPLWKQHGELLRFRCFTGHAITAAALREGQDENLEATLWAAIRQFEQRANLLGEWADQEKSSGRPRISEINLERATEARQYAETLRTLLLGMNKETSLSAVE